jgi:hypothetical protein
MRRVEPRGEIDATFRRVPLVSASGPLPKCQPPAGPAGNWGALQGMKESDITGSSPGFDPPIGSVIELIGKREP